MMFKLKLANLIFFALSTSNILFAQSGSFSAELPEEFNPFLCENNGKMIYYTTKNVANTAFTRFEYFVIDTKNPNAKKEEYKAKVEFEKGGGDAEYVEEYQGVIYEFYNITTFTYGSLGSCIVRRDASTFEQIGEKLIIEDQRYKFARIDEEGIYFLTNKELHRYDFELNKLWNKNLDILEETGVSLNSTEIDENLNLLMSISITEQVESKFFGTTPPAKSALMFIITDLTGEVVVVTPQIPRDMSVRHARFNYNEEKKELTGFFILNSANHTYIHVIWDVEGNILSTAEHTFGKEMVEDQTNVDYAAFYKIKMEKYQFRFSSNNVSMKYLEDGSLFCVHKTTHGYLSEFLNSKMMYVIAPNGDLVWSKLIPYNSNELYKNSHFYIHNGKVHLIITEFTETYSSGKYEVKKLKSPVNGKTVLFSERIFDLKNGEEISNQPLVANPSERFIPSTVIYNKEDKVILRYNYTIKNLIQFYTIELK